MQRAVVIPPPVRAPARAGEQPSGELALPVLQRAAGNRALVRALSRPRGGGSAGRPAAARSGQRAGGPALAALARHGPARKPAREVAAEGRSDPVAQDLDVDGEPARVFDGPASRRAATRLGGYAYTWRGDVFLGEGVGLPGAPSREAVLRHEAAHVRQSRRAGARSSPAALEAEAHRAGGPGTRGHGPTADPDEPLGWWWVVPAAAGAYVLLRPNTANAPTHEDVEQGRLVPSTSELQVAAEAFALFGLPAGVAGWLARSGYGVVTSFALSGAASAASFRGVQDVGAGEFSGVEAYVVDATTGAVIGIVAGGVFRSLRGPGALGPREQPGGLIHLTDEAGAAGIQSQGVLRGSQGIYAVPESVAAEGTVMRTLRTLLRPAQTSQVVPVPQAAGGAFTQPATVGPVSLYQRLMGVHRAPAGAVSMSSGAFTPGSARLLPNVTGQFFPYGADAMFWFSLMALSPAAEDAGERGLGWLGLPTLPYVMRDAVSGQEPLAEATRTDGPFVVLPPSELGLDSPEEVVAAARAGYDPVEAVCLPPAETSAATPALAGAEPLVILVAPQGDLPFTY